MRGRLWLRTFFRALETVRKRTPDFEKIESDRDWTNFIGDVMSEVGANMGCKVVRRRETSSEKKIADMTPEEQKVSLANFSKGYWEESREYLNIDAVFINESEYGLHTWGAKGIRYGPFALPEAVAELENSWDVDRICYCLWKILCIRAPVRVLICYQKNKEMTNSLRQRLESVIWGSSLMKGTDGDLLVIVGQEILQTKPWSEYFSVFEWRHDSLETVDPTLTTR